MFGVRFPAVTEAVSSLEVLEEVELLVPNSLFAADTLAVAIV